MKLCQLSELDAHIMFRGEWLKCLGIPIWNISEVLYRQKNFHVDLQTGEQVQQFYFLSAFVLFWKGSSKCRWNQDVKRKSKQRLCALYSQVVRCWQLSRVHCLKVMWVPEEIHKQVVWWGLRNKWCPNPFSAGCFFMETVLTIYIQLVIQKVVFAARWDCFIQYFQKTLGEKNVVWHIQIEEISFEKVEISI